MPAVFRHMTKHSGHRGRVFLAGPLPGRRGGHLTGGGPLPGDNRIDPDIRRLPVLRRVRHRTGSIRGAGQDPVLISNMQPAVGEVMHQTLAPRIAVPGPPVFTQYFVPQWLKASAFDKTRSS